MGCGASSVPKINAKPGLFEAELEHWWTQIGSKGLRDCYMASEYADKEKWANHMVDFIEKSFKTLKHVQKGSDDKRLKPVTKDEYIKTYTDVLKGRTNGPKSENLWNLKCEADAYLKKAVATIKEPALKLLLSTFLREKEALVWSQGSFAPQTSTRQFLETYVNAMLSGDQWDQPKEGFQMAYHGKRAEFLESGIFFIKPGVEYPLHYHEAMEAYYILSGTTRFVLMVEDEKDSTKSKLKYIEKKAGEWHFNPPWVPHAIVTPHGQPHLALWFREGGVGELQNNKAGYKWIGDVDGMEMLTPDERGAFEKFCMSCIGGDPEVKRHNSDPNLIGSLGFKPGSVASPENDHYFRVLKPSEFELLNDDPKALENLNKSLTPENQAKLQNTIRRLQFKNMSERSETQYF